MLTTTILEFLFDINDMHCMRAGRKKARHRERKSKEARDRVIAKTHFHKSPNTQ